MQFDGSTVALPALDELIYHTAAQNGTAFDGSSVPANALPSFPSPVTSDANHQVTYGLNNGATLTPADPSTLGTISTDGLVHDLDNGSAQFIVDAPGSLAQAADGGTVVAGPVTLGRGGQPIATPWLWQSPQSTLSGVPFFPAGDNVNLQVNVLRATGHTGVILKSPTFAGYGSFHLYPLVGRSSTPDGLNIGPGLGGPNGSFIQVGRGIDDQGRQAVVFSGSIVGPGISGRANLPDGLAGIKSALGPFGVPLPDSLLALVGSISPNAGATVEVYYKKGTEQAPQIDEVRVTGNAGVFAQIGVQLLPNQLLNSYAGSVGLYGAGGANVVQFDFKDAANGAAQSAVPSNDAPISFTPLNYGNETTARNIIDQQLTGVADQYNPDGTITRAVPTSTGTSIWDLSRVSGGLNQGHAALGAANSVNDVLHRFGILDANSFVTSTAQARADLSTLFQELSPATASKVADQLSNTVGENFGLPQIAVANVRLWNSMGQTEPPDGVQLQYFNNPRYPNN